MSNQALIDQVPALVDEIISRIGFKFKFGPYEVEDLKQEAYLWAMEKIEVYDGRSTLRNFLYQVIYRNCCNLKRAKFERRSTPCERCPLAAYCKETDTCQAYGSRDDCEYWRRWILRNEQKKALNLSFDGAGQVDKDGRSHEEVVEDNDMIIFLHSRVKDTKGLSILLTGGHLSSPRYEELLENIRECLEDEF